MIVAFIHDHFFFKHHDGRIYSPGGLPSSVWQKYLMHFEKVIVVGRFGGHISSNEKYVLSSHENVEFTFVEKISDPKGIFRVKSVVRSISEVVKSSNAVIARLPSENGLIATNIAHKCNIPYAIEVVGCAFDSLWNYGGLLSKAYAPILFLRMKKSVQKASFVLYVTDNYLQKKYPYKEKANNINVSDVFINASNFEYPDNKISDRLINNEFVYFGIIGNFKSRYKGLHIAIEALGKLKQEHNFDNFKLKILGKGDRSDYESLINKYALSKNIIFEGSLPSGVPVFNWLDEISVYLQPSLTEGLPRALIEAMSRANVCIGSDAGGIPELLPEDFVVKSGSVKDLEDKILEVIHLPAEKLRAISELNFQKAQQYDAEFLNRKRNQFFALLAKDALESK